MKVFKNEKGYTLLLTLIIILMIIIFSSSFALSAMNQHKQVEHTDSKYEVTAVAEMGIEYYHAEIINLITTVRSKLDSEISLIQNNSNLTVSEKVNAIKSVELTTRTNLTKGLDCLDGYNNSTSKPCNPDETLSISKGKDIDKLNSIKFTLLNSKLITNSKSQLEVLVKGSIPNKDYEISAIFNLPNNLLTVTLISNGENVKGDGNQNTPIYPKCDIQYSNKPCKVDSNVVFSTPFVISGGLVQFNRAVTLTKKNIGELTNTNIYMDQLIINTGKENGNANSIKVGKDAKLCIRQISENDAKKINTNGGKVYILATKNFRIENAINFVKQEEFDINCNFMKNPSDDKYTITPTDVNFDIIDSVTYH
ncbi:hypothetical protein [Psychrobacillus sp. NPDC096623]|uniref:hypothetical protein n=1 Tax=Psychrobacillus sp. NPDC096623 TaxID=3364492 RepID=UPI0038100FF8